MKFQIVECKVSLKKRTYYTFVVYYNNKVFTRLGYYIPLKNYYYVSINLPKLYYLLINYNSQIYVNSNVYEKIFLIYYYYLKMFKNNNSGVKNKKIKKV